MIARLWSARVTAAVLALGSAAACGKPPSGPPAPTPTQPSWVLVWSDEFEGAAGTGIDGTKWVHDLGDGCQSGNCGWGNQEKEYYTSSAENIARNGNGQLEIVGRVASAGLTCYYGPCRYTSAKITTRGKFHAAPGKVEARIKLPPGQGLWPAFWMLGENFPTTPWPNCGELDIMEFRGSQLSSVSSAIHGPGYSGNTPFVHANVLGQQTYADALHTFSVIWGPALIQFLVDDVLHYTVSRSEIQQRGNYVFDQPFFIILNLAIGGHFDGDPQSDAILPATMVVDFVRVYRLEN
jgi:beta-glucanase (GH16 family)